MFARSLHPLHALLPVLPFAVSAVAAPMAISSGTLSLNLNIDLGQALASSDTGSVAYQCADLFAFTSLYTVSATPDQVVNGTTATGGLSGASGTFAFGINSDANMICYNITLHGFQGEYESPAATATHIHEAAKGASGPPRIAFPNPEPVEGHEGVRRSAGCLTGPFTTGLLAEGKDTGEGFHVRMIEENPADFMADTHSSLALPGAVRGQLG